MRNLLLWTPGFWEIVIILVVVLLLFGPQRLPQLGSALGKALTNFKRGLKGEDEIDVTPGKPTEQAPGQQRLADRQAEPAHSDATAQREREPVDKPR